MQRVEHGKIALDHPVGRYLPDPPQRWRAITVRQLLNHSAGLPEYPNETQMSGSGQANAWFPANLPAVFAQLADKPLLFASGAQTRYAQTNYVLLAHLLETQYGKPYPAIAAERIIKPLRLRHTYLGDRTLPEQGVVSAYLSRNGPLQRQPDIAWPRDALGHAGLYRSLGDLAAFLQAASSSKLVARATQQQLWRPQPLANGQTGWFAAGWELGDSGAYRMAGHDSGASAYGFCTKAHCTATAIARFIWPMADGGGLVAHPDGQPARHRGGAAVPRRGAGGATDSLCTEGVRRHGNAAVRQRAAHRRRLAGARAGAGREQQRQCNPFQFWRRSAPGRFPRQHPAVAGAGQYLEQPGRSLPPKAIRPTPKPRSRSATHSPAVAAECGTAPWRPR